MAGHQAGSPSSVPKTNGTSLAWKVPDAERSSLAGQLTAIDGRLDKPLRDEMKSVIASMSEESKTSLRRALAARGAEEKPWVRSLGL
jgi:hypothetical protein